ncbi:HAMP domain-containing sensor histidine kinase [Nannocystis sp. SCPEA4]|uniref:sensor histidine kinase n=1 Tax=Nannocystis sp. SCPEA4 TaxID=2996787 RepID=UPI00226D4F15|nr:HAMP domain-containing sensor histidine kinase [Nannocystis sp. SCPEA4]MCY1061525.1 HAMP domain-containing sensor histidine kinase [Nannocystis sp. SCPEA4]
MRRLYLLIYLAFLAIAVVSVVVAGFAGRYWFHDSRPLFGPTLRKLAELVVERLPAEPAAQGPALAAIAEELELELALWDSSGALVAATRRAEAVTGESPQEGVERVHGGLVMTVQLGDGRWLASIVDDGFLVRQHQHFLQVLSTLALLIALMCYPLARRITRRVEHLQHGVERLGAGDFQARVQVEGRDEIAELARQFNAAADRIETLVAGQRRMLANASHELRSPLARLRMAVELLSDAAPQQRAAAHEASRDIEELDVLVGDLLLASRLAARPPARDPVDLAPLLTEEAARAGASAMSVGTCELSGDAPALRSLVRNLLENARRHGEPPIEARVEATPTGVRVLVEDHGPGVPPAEREHIFEAFYRPAGHRALRGSSWWRQSLRRGAARVRRVSTATGAPADVA